MISSSSCPMQVAANAVTPATTGALFLGVQMDSERFNLPPSSTGYGLALLWAAVGVIFGLVGLTYVIVGLWGSL